MKIKLINIVSILSFIIFVFCTYLISSGSSIMTTYISSKIIIPYGTLITWIGLISFPVTGYTAINQIYTPSTKVEKILNITFKIAISLAIFWGYISYLLSGNWSYTFNSTEGVFEGSNKAFYYFITYTYIPIIITFVSLLAFFNNSLVNVLIKRNNK